MAQRLFEPEEHRRDAAGPLDGGELTRARLCAEEQLLAASF